MPQTFLNQMARQLPNKTDIKNNICGCQELLQRAMSNEQYEIVTEQAEKIAKLSYLLTIMER